MKLRTLLVPFGMIALLAAVLAATSLFVVAENEQVVIVQFGLPVGEPITKQGLHFKIPIVHRAISLSTEPVLWSWTGELVTRDRVQVVGELFVHWRITDPLAFLQRVRDEAGAATQLEGILPSAARDAIARRDLVELVALTAGGPARAGDEGAGPPGDRASVLQEILAAAKQHTADFGMEIVEVGFESLKVRE